MRDFDPIPGDDTPQRTRELLAAVRAATGSKCKGCGAVLCGHGAVMSHVLGHRHDPHCAPCLARELGETPASLAERSLQWVRRRECLLRGWLWASAHEGDPGSDRPRCLFGAAGEHAASPASPHAGAIPTEVDATWDAGAMGCGDLVLELRTRLRALEPGAVLAVRAEDPGAPVDIPAWCGLTGHTLLGARHPDYWILRKDS